MAQRISAYMQRSPGAAVLLLVVASVVADCTLEGGCNEPVGSTAERSMINARVAQDKALRDAEAWVEWINGIRDALYTPLQRQFSAASPQTRWTTLSVMALCAICTWLWLQDHPKDRPSGVLSADGSLTTPGSSHTPENASSDPGLLRKHSDFKSYTITVAGRSITYPTIRTFFSPHPQAAKLPTSPNCIPLLVFIHGLGGSVAQFSPLLTSLVNVAPCLAIDLPGCGLSTFEPKTWDSYQIETLAELLGAVIDQHRDKQMGQEVVLIGHSLGCSISLLLASSTSPLFAAKQLAKHIVGLVAICPRAEPPTAKQVVTYRRLLRIPGSVFDLWRSWDRRGGTESASVARFVGVGAEEQTKRLQVRFNEQSKTPVWRRMASGTLPDHTKQHKGGIPGREVWQGLRLPTMLIAGEVDKVTPATELEKIASFLGKTSNREASEKSHESEAVTDAAAPVNTGTPNQQGGIPSAGPHLNEERSVQQPKIHRAPLKTTILPAPAGHALLYAPSSVRIIAGLIQSFLADHIDPRLSLGWQLQYLTTEGKWDVKNFVKWQRVTCVSEPIPSPAPDDAPKLDTKSSQTNHSVARALPTKTTGAVQRKPIFRAMKTLREVDNVHSPTVFVQHWHGKIKAVIDISHESPVYDPNGLEKGGIQYYKFPTVSKLPPTPDEVSSFITLVDRLREELHIATEAEQNERSEQDLPPDSMPVIGVHCHYGFNRTGFFVVSYLVERLGFRLQDAIDEFERQRPPGIRHGHFIDALFVRYCVGLKRAPTL